MFSALLVAAFLISPGPGPAGLKVELDTPPGACVTILNGDQVITPGKVYATKTQRTVKLLVKWVDGDTCREQYVTVTLRPGYVSLIRLTINATPIVRLC